MHRDNLLQMKRMEFVGAERQITLPSIFDLYVPLVNKTQNTTLFVEDFSLFQNCRWDLKTGNMTVHNQFFSFSKFTIAASFCDDVLLQSGFRKRPVDTKKFALN